LEADEKNLLHHIMQGSFLYSDEDGKLCRRNLTDEEIVAHVHSLIGGGIGTLNASIEFTIHMLAVNPSIQQKIYDSILRVCGSEV
jgi:cytochrome P450